MSRQPWFERKFQFQLAPENYHDVLVRLIGTPLQLHALCSKVTPEQATARDGERWSIQENVGHLLDLEPLWSGRTDDLISGLATLRPADLENRQTHEADHNGARLGRLIEGFARARGAWTDRLHSLSTDDFVRAARHPRLDQPMRLIDHCVFVAEHDAHHLGRILQMIAD